jgi:hypothetical protein
MEQQFPGLQKSEVRESDSDIFNELPRDLLFEVMCQMDIPTLYALVRTSRRAAQIFQTDFFQTRCVESKMTLGMRFKRHLKSDEWQVNTSQTPERLGLTAEGTLREGTPTGRGDLEYDVGYYVNVGMTLPSDDPTGYVPMIEAEANIVGHSSLFPPGNPPEPMIQILRSTVALALKEFVKVYRQQISELGLAQRPVFIVKIHLIPRLGPPGSFAFEESITLEGWSVEDIMRQFDEKINPSALRRQIMSRSFTLPIRS